MSEQELTPIERLCAQWEPNEARIAELKADRDKAIECGDLLTAFALDNSLWLEMQPPRNLPIKRMDVTE